MSASDDDKPLCDATMPDMSEHIAHLPVAPKPKRGRGRPRKNESTQPSAAAAAAVVEPEPTERVPTPPPCPHVAARHTPPLSVDSDSEAEEKTELDPVKAIDAMVAAATPVDEKPIVVDILPKDARISCLLRTIDEQNSKLQLFENTINIQNEGLAALHEENALLRHRVPAPEDPDTTWDTYLVGTATGLALGVMLRKVAAMLF